MTIQALRVLKTISTHGPAAGTHISQQISISNGTLYPLLRRLERAKLIRGVWTSKPRTIRGQRGGSALWRLYTITATGRSKLNREIAALEGLIRQ